MAGSLPTGTVTFLFTDVERSTALLQRLGPEAYAEALAEHRAVVRTMLQAYAGVEVDTQGDSFFCVFGSARAAVECAGEILARMGSTPIRLRIGVHTGEALVVGDRYVGMDVHRAARIGACGHGGQAVLSPSTVALLEPDAVTLTDLGEHRLKDLSAPVRLHQLGTRDFPPLKTLFRTNLPVPATDFVGRAEEIAALVERASVRSVRLLTLTGPGGTGKTRLALQLAGELAERFPDGVQWAPLAPLRNPALVASTVAQVLGVEEQAGSPLEGTIAREVGDAALLLLLDNCEHLLEGCAALAQAFVAGCPNALVIATSREPLRLTGEQVAPVDPLAPADAAALFEARAQAAGAQLPGTEESRSVIAELCARLDELPLALELAAARAAAIPPAVLLERLAGRLDALRGPRDAEERQHTLRAAIAWSYDLLEPAEARLFRRLAAFRGGATLEAAETVCEAGLVELVSLVEKSLVRQQEQPDGLPRYWMLETIRAFAAATLEEVGEGDAVRDRHLDWFASLASGPELRAGGAATRELLDRLERERENLRAAFDRASASGRVDAVVALADALARLHDVHGRWGEAVEAVREALALEPGGLRTASLESMLGVLLLHRRRTEDAWEAHRSAEARLGPPTGERSAAWWEAWIDVKLRQAQHHYWQADAEKLAATTSDLDPFVESRGTPRQRRDYLQVRLHDAFRRERYAPSAETEALERELYRLSREAGDANVDFRLGFGLLWRRELEEAEHHLRMGLEEARERGAVLLEVRCIVYTAVACRLQGDIEGARTLLAELEALEDELGYSGLAAAMRCWVAVRDGDLDAAEAFGRAALADWQGGGRSGPTVFHWTARFPLLRVALARGRVEEALEHAGAMLDPSQQPLPRELAEPVALAVERHDAVLLGHALEVASASGYA